jgi:hypothetical protein
MFWDKKKIVTLSLLSVLAIFAYIANSSSSNSRVLDITPEYFAIKDSLSIRTIILSTAQNQKVELSASPGGWLVNGQYRASELNLGRLLYILKNVRAKRELTNASSKSTIERIRNEGVRIKVMSGDKVLNEFITDNGEITSSSCFYDIKTNKAYFVELPNVHTDHFSNFFKTDPNLWRSRLITNNSLKSLVTLTSNLAGKEVKFTYKNAFFEIPNVKNIDSNTVGMYLIQFRNLECDGFLEDSLKRFCTKDFEKAFASITITDLDTAKNNKLYFFELPNQKKRFMGYSKKLDECFWLSKSKTMDLLIETEKLFEKQKQQ